MKNTAGLKSLDLTEIASNKSKKTNFVPDSKILQNKLKSTNPKNIFEESVISQSSRSILLRNRENSIQTYHKYLKMLDPSFLKDEENNENNFKSISISTHNLNNSHIPHKILKLLPLDKNISEPGFKSFTKASNKKFLLGDLSHRLTEKILQNKEKDVNDKTIENPLKLEDLSTINKFVQGKLELEKFKDKKKIQSCNDISSIKNIKNEDTEIYKANQSIILKDYYKSNDGNSIQEVSLKEKKINVYLQMFEHSHNGKLLDTDFDHIKDKLVNSYDQETSQILASKAKIIDLNYVVDGSSNNAENLEKDKESSIRRVNALSLHEKTQYRDSKLSSTRSEIKNLEEWLNMMISNVNSRKNLNDQNKFLDIQLIYTACLKELIRQVSLHCSERGALIQRIWDEYLQTVEKAIILERKQNTKTENLQINEITKIHSLYENELNNMAFQYNSAMNQLETLKNNIDKYKNERNYSAKLLMNSENKLNILQNELLNLKKNYDTLLTENYSLKLTADENLNSNQLFRISKANTAQIECSPLIRNRKISKVFDTMPLIGNSIVSHLIEVEEKEKYDESNFAKKETIESINDKKKIGVTSQMLVSTLSVDTNVKPVIEKQKLIFPEFFDDIELFELTEVGVDTNDLFERKDQEIMTDNVEISIINQKDQNENIKNEADDDFAIIKENCSTVEEMIEELEIRKLKKENLFNIIDNIKSKVKTLASKNNRSNFIENELANLKEENTKLKIEINELYIERDQLKELDQGREKDILDIINDYGKIKFENKIIKKDMKSFQNSIDTIQNLLHNKHIDEIKNEDLDEIRKSTTNIIKRNNAISEFRDSYNIYNKEADSESDDNDFEEFAPKASTFLKQMGLNKKRKDFKQSIKRIYSVNTGNADILLHQIHRKSEQKENGSTITINLLLKFISRIYQEKIKQEKSQMYVPLHVTCYEFLLNRYGLKHVVDQNLKKIFSACLRFKYKNHRVAMFSKLLGLEDESDSDDCIYFINCMKYLNENCSRQIHMEIKEKIFIDYSIALSLVEHLFKSDINENNLKKLTDYMDEFKTIDSILQTQVIEFDLLMLKIFEVYTYQKDEMKNHLKYLFYAADLNQDQYIELYEFILIYRHIEKDSFVFDDVRRMFVEKSDCIVPMTGERAISFVKFINLAIEFHLFDEMKTKAFAEVMLNEEIIKNFEDLKIHYETKIEQLKIRFIKGKNFNSLFKSLMMHLEEKIKNSQDYDEKILWLSYRLLDEESKRIILDHSIYELLPPEFKFISEINLEMNQIELELI